MSTVAVYFLKKAPKMKTLKKTVFAIVLCFQISSGETQAQSTLRRRNLKTAFSKNTWNVFRSHYAKEI